MPGLLSIFDPQLYGGQMAGLLGNLPGYQAQLGTSQGFPGMPTDMSGQGRAPMQLAPQASQMPMPMQGAPAAPQMGFLDRLGAGLGANSNTLLAMGASLLGGKGFGGAAEAAMTGRDMDRKQATVTQTEQALLARGLSPDVAKVAARNPALLTAVLTRQLGLSGQTDDIKEYQFAKSQGFTGSLEQWMQRKRAGAGEYGLQGIWGVGPDGKPALVQLGKSGEAIQSKLPEGFTPAKDPIKVDAGTHFVLLDPQTRQQIAIVPKDLAGEAAQKKIGAGQGDAVESLTSMTSKMPGLEKVVATLDDLAERATYTLAGQGIDYARRQLGAEPRDAAIARAQYVSMVDNQILPLLRDTFGAQFTEREGATLRQTLGDPDKSPKEKQAILKAFIEQKRRDVQALQSRVGGQAAPVSAGGSDGWKIERVQ